jgi:hypothetical protein
MSETDILDSTKKKSPNQGKSTTLKRPKIVESSVSEDQEDSDVPHQASVIPKFVHTLK